MTKAFFKIMMLTAVTSIMSILPIQAQSDFGTEIEAKISKKIIPRLTLSVGEEFRTRDNLSTVDRWNTSVGLDYKICPYLSVGGAYNFIRFNHETKGWETRNRYYFHATGSLRLSNVKLSLRERFQSTYRVGVKETETRSNPKLFLRSRLKAEYDIPHSAFSPFTSIELFNKLNDKAGNGVGKIRYTAGCEYKINKRNDIELYYQYTNLKDDDEFNGKHIIGLGYAYDF